MLTVFTHPLVNITFKNQSLESKHFEKGGFAYRGVNFKPADLLVCGNCIFRALVLSELIPFNDHLELRKDLMGRMRNVLRDDSDIGIFLEYFFRSKCCPDKQGWTDEFTTKTFEEYLGILRKLRSLVGDLDNFAIHWLYSIRVIALFNLT